jgi:hypothetical protein
MEVAGMKYEIGSDQSKTDAGLAKLAIIGSLFLAVGDMFFHNMMGGAFVAALAGALLYHEAYSHQVSHTQFIVDKMEGKQTSRF